MFDTVPAAWVAEFAQAEGIDLATFDRAAIGPAEGSARRHPSFELPRQERSFSHYVGYPNGDHIALLVGPFASSTEARSWLKITREYYVSNGDTSTADAIAVMRLVVRPLDARAGDLNVTLGVTTAR